MTQKFTFILACCALLPLVAYAQRFPEHRETAEARNRGKAILVHLTAGAHLPGGDLADRFKHTGSFGGGVEWMTAGNVAFGIEGHYQFGSQVKDDPLALIRTPEGAIIGNDQFLAEVDLRARGHYLGGYLGKLFPIGKQRSGIRITFGAGAMRHKIRLQDNNNTAVQVSGDYAKGYDRLTGGLALQQFIGWQHLGANRRSNWFFGFELNQGFTTSLRDWDFTEMRKLDEKRTDLRFGIRLGWTLPFYQGGADKIYY